MNNIIVKADSGVAVAPEIIKQITLLEKQAKEIKDKQKEMQKVLCEAMEQYGVKKIDNESFVLTYVAEHDTERFDSKAFKEENPDVYDMYVKITKTSPSVRIKLK